MEHHLTIAPTAQAVTNADGETVVVVLDTDVEVHGTPELLEALAKAANRAAFVEARKLVRDEALELVSGGCPECGRPIGTSGGTRVLCGGAYGPTCGWRNRPSIEPTTIRDRALVAEIRDAWKAHR